MTRRPSDQEQQLSIALTFASKFIFPPLWLGGFAIGAVALAVNHGGPPPLVVAAVLIFGAIFFSRWGFPLEKVIATESGLAVSNFRREIFVRYDRIASVSENKFLSMRPITVELRSATPFGRAFTFRPYTAFVLLGDHPAATLVRERAEAARG